MNVKMKTKTWSAKDKFMAVKSTPLSEAVGQTILIKAIATGTDISAETSQEIATGYVRALNEGSEEIMFSTISKTSITQLEALIEMMQEPDCGDIYVVIKEQVCKKDKKQSFIYFDFA